MRPPSCFEAVAARVLAGGAGLVLGFIAACAPFNAPTTSCTQDADCGLETLQCGAGGHCEERCSYPFFWCGTRCARCCDDQACASDQHCNADGICEFVCPGGRHFCPDGHGGGVCAQCCTDAHCGPAGSGFVCTTGTCACGGGLKACDGACVPLGTCCRGSQDMLPDGGCAP